MDLHISYTPNDSYCPQVMLPPSKSIEARRMVLEAVRGTVPWIDPGACDDLKVLAQALRGYVYREHVLNVGLSGTALRFLTALCAATPGYRVRIVGEPGIERRPVGPLAGQLRRLGAEVSADSAPIDIVGARIDGSRIDVEALLATNSSQYMSAMLLAQPLMSAPLPAFELPHTAPSWSYIRMTNKMLAGDLAPEPDWSAASYFYLITLLTGVKTSFRPPLLKPGISKQGDALCFKFGSYLGVGTNFTRTRTMLMPNGMVQETYEFRLGGTPDLVPTLAVATGFYGYGGVVRDIAHLSVKESNRLESITAALNAIGVEASHDDTSITMGEREPRRLAVIDCCGDHRIAMAFAPCAAFLPEGVTLKGGECVSKSFPEYFGYLRKYGYRICKLG